MPELLLQQPLSRRGLNIQKLERYLQVMKDGDKKEVHFNMVCLKITKNLVKTAEGFLASTPLSVCLWGSKPEKFLHPHPYHPSTFPGVK